MIGCDQLFRFLSGLRYGVVCSLSETGTPQSAVVGVAVTPRLEIVFDTLRETRKYRNLIARPPCSFVFFEGERTIQYEGCAREPHGPELARYQDVYFRTWPDGLARLSWPGLVHLAVRPEWIRYSDFDQTPPRIEEWKP